MAEVAAPVPVIVVGIDGSTSSEEVLRWAVREARGLRTRLRVVLAWQLPEVPGYLPPRVESNLSEAAENLVDDLVAKSLTGLDVRPGELDVETVVQEGGAVRLLLSNCHDAHLLVLGSHGYGCDGVKLLGSVTQSCLVQAPCPVVVVPVSRRVGR